MITRLLLFNGLLAVCLCSPLALKVKRDLVADEGLYGGDNKVVSLNVSTFNSIYGTDNAWLVEFYSSWCGHCQRFAPTWKKLADDVIGWSDVTKIAAIDCAAEINGPHCRDYQIAAYPTIRFFPARADSTNKGLDVLKRGSVEELRHSIVFLLVKEESEGRGTNWPNLTAYRNNNAAALWNDVPASVQHQIIVYENETSLLGAELILDLHKVEDIHVKRILYETSATENRTVPRLLTMKRNEEARPLNTTGTTREDFLAAIRNYLVSQSITINPAEMNPSFASSPSEEERHESHSNSSQYKSNMLYQVDLENALRYSLKREVAVKNHIHGEAMEALKHYLHALAAYFPTTTEGKRFLEQLRDWVSQRNEVSGSDFLTRVEDLEREYKQIFQSDEEWLGCKGSEIRYRGYPCGLWTLFHTLTTNAVIEKGDTADFNSLQLLTTMEGYIKNFFGCRECSAHFLEMTTESLRGNVSQPNDSVFWLWKAHNNVNKRLSGDVTEDPQHPKIQFPSQQSCPKCRDSHGQWVENEVLKFLKQMYGKSHINYTRWNGTRSTNTSENIPSAESLASRSSSVTLPFISSTVVLATLITCLVS